MPRALRARRCPPAPSRGRRAGPRPAGPRGGTGAPGRAPTGPGVPQLLADFSAETRVRKVGPPLAVLQLTRGGRGCGPARGSLWPPTLHLTPRAVTSSPGTDPTAVPEAGREPGLGGGRRPREEPFPFYRVFQNILFMNRLT